MWVLTRHETREMRLYWSLVRHWSEQTLYCRMSYVCCSINRCLFFFLFSRLCVCVGHSKRFPGGYSTWPFSTLVSKIGDGRYNGQAMELIHWVQPSCILQLLTSYRGEDRMIRSKVYRGPPHDKYNSIYIKTHIMMGGWNEEGGVCEIAIFIFSKTACYLSHWYLSVIGSVNSTRNFFHSDSTMNEWYTLRI